MERTITSLLCMSPSALVFIIGFSWLKNDVSAQQSRQIDAAIPTCGATHTPTIGSSTLYGKRTRPFH